MKKIGMGTAIIGLAFFIISCASTGEKAMQESGIQPLTQAELEELYSVDKTATWKSKRGGGTINYMADGRAAIRRRII